MAQLDARPLLFVISGPSGAGKGTALQYATRALSLRRVPTYTTRPRRSGEVDGVDYEYVDDKTFFRLYEAGTIFEYTRTYAQSYYGSPAVLLRDEISEALAVELDPNGFVRVRAASARRVVGIFVTTSSEDELRSRLAARAQDRDISQRLSVRTDQLVWAWIYDYVIFNEDQEQFRADLKAVVEAELLRTSGARRMLSLRRELDPTLPAEPRLRPRRGRVGAQAAVQAGAPEGPVPVLGGPDDPVEPETGFDQRSLLSQVVLVGGRLDPERRRVPEQVVTEQALRPPPEPLPAPLGQQRDTDLPVPDVDVLPGDPGHEPGGRVAGAIVDHQPPVLRAQIPVLGEPPGHLLAIPVARPVQPDQPRLGVEPLQ